MKLLRQKSQGPQQSSSSSANKETRHPVSAASITTTNPRSDVKGSSDQGFGHQTSTKGGSSSASSIQDKGLSIIRAAPAPVNADEDDDQSSIISRPFSLLSNDLDPETHRASSSSSPFTHRGPAGFDLHFSLINLTASTSANSRVTAALGDVLGDAVGGQTGFSSSKPKGNKKQR